MELAETYLSEIVVGGIYEHYKGGKYTVVGLARHHESRSWSVLYVSHMTGAMNHRPLVGNEGDPDGWFTPIPLAQLSQRGQSDKRFRLIKPDGG